MNPLEQIIRQQIEGAGPMDIGTFMALALGHPQYGYYMTRDPLGALGDFTTAPEISQMFGELLGLWAANTWIAMGQPTAFQLIECGPGRGTLMADVLRATKRVPGFHEAMQVVMIETSPVLAQKQMAALAGYNAEWVDGLHHAVVMAATGPLILLANEFLDALPVKQLQTFDGKWYERAIRIDKDNNLALCLIPWAGEIPAGGDIYEFSPYARFFVQNVAQIIEARGGAALFIDYGYDGPASGETLQAVSHHKYAPVLENIGAADLTAHVDFASLKKIALEEGIVVKGPVGQGAFLLKMEIAERAEILLRAANDQQKQDIVTAVTRLTNPAQMGELFKVMALAHDGKILNAGF